MEETLEELHNEIKNQEKLTTKGPPTQPIGGGPGEGKIRREEISHKASNNLMLQTQTVRGLCYVGSVVRSATCSVFPFTSWGGGGGFFAEGVLIRESTGRNSRPTGI